MQWTSAETFEIGGARFRIDYAVGGTTAKSRADEFIIVKGRNFIERYQSLRSEGLKRVLELGVFQGGSFVFFDKLYFPNKIAAIEITNEPLPALDEYVAKNSDRARIYYGLSQDNTIALHEIVADYFGGEIDIVIDDASHFYDLTKSSFLALYPKLRPGGIYIIEDWSWSFTGPFQAPDAPWQDQKALVNLVFELLEEVALNNSITDLTITPDMVIIRKPPSGAPAPLLTRQARRGRKMPEL